MIEIKFEDVEINSERWLDLKDLLNEEWRDIKEYEGRYKISNYGRVKTLERQLRCRIKNNNKRIQKAKIKKIRYDKDGYCKVSLCEYGKKTGKSFFVHRLVAIAFIPNPANKPVVNHKDGKKNNNKPYNLEWNTVRENTIHAIKKGLMKPIMPTRNIRSGKDNPKSRAIYMIDIKENIILKKFDTMKEASDFLNIKGTSGIGQCCRKEIKTAYGYKWSYIEDRGEDNC